MEWSSRSRPGDDPEQVRLVRDQFETAQLASERLAFAETPDDRSLAVASGAERGCVDVIRTGNKLFHIYGRAVTLLAADRAVEALSRLPGRSGLARFLWATPAGVGATPFRCRCGCRGRERRLRRGRPFAFERGKVRQAAAVSHADTGIEKAECRHRLGDVRLWSSRLGFLPDMARRLADLASRRRKVQFAATAGFPKRLAAGGPFVTVVRDGDATPSMFDAEWSLVRRSRAAAAAASQ